MRAAISLLLTLAAAPAFAASRPPVRAEHGMVASSSALASEAGVEILKKGGNAVDAAVAVALALAVTHPTAGNLGGGGFMLLRMADGRATAIDYRETAPKAATAGMYLDAQGKVVRDASTLGYRAVGVPGTVAGMELALKKYGTRTFAQVAAPAIRLASRGFLVTQPVAEMLNASAEKLSANPESARVYLRGNKPYAEGERMKLPDLARTLERLGKVGTRDFYTGVLAKKLAADMAAHGGLITLEDLRDYQAKERPVLRGTYRGHEILTMPPPSSGGATLLQELHILEGYDLGKLGPGGSGELHLLAEAMRFAFADRARYFGDPDFVKIPIEALTSPAYATQQRAGIRPDKATPSSAIGPNRPPPAEGLHTTHFTVIDAKGNVVSNTFTLNLPFGSGVTVPGTGILLNDEMDDFTSAPNAPNAFGLIQGEANAIAPSKRPLSSMDPTIVLDPQGKVWFALGSPGGPTIINTVLQVVVNVIDQHLDLQAAIDAPRIHQQWLPDVLFYEQNGLNPDTAKVLAGMGYALQQTRWQTFGDCEAVMVEPGTGIRLGASDPRNADSAAIGY